MAELKTLDELDEMMDVEKASKRIGVCKETLKRLALAKKIEAYKVGGKYLFTEEALISYINSTKVKVEN